MRFSHIDFGSLVQALYSIEKGITKELWSESSPTNSKGKKPLGGQRSGDVGVISLAGLRSPRCYQTVEQTSGLYYSPHHLSSIGHEYLINRMIRPTCLPR